jgi:FkbM family methyltransferase
MVWKRLGRPAAAVSAEASLVGSIEQLWAQAFDGDAAVIWDVGSRDGEQSLQLLHKFPAAAGVAFEPNPDTQHLVAKAASTSKRLDFLPVALSDVDGEAVFMKIDRERTQTAWADGNPGASSLFAASAEYPHETYVQTPVNVRTMRTDTYLKTGGSAPDIIWMDVQGAELHVLRGFGSAIADVGLVSVECSLREMYIGQPLAAEVVDFMASRGFLWWSCPNRGSWQFDAMFVNGAKLRPKIRRRAEARDRLLRAFLKSGFPIGIDTVPGVVRSTFRATSSRLRLTR